MVQALRRVQLSQVVLILKNIAQAFMWLHIYFVTEETANLCTEVQIKNWRFIGRLSVNHNEVRLDYM